MKLGILTFHSQLNYGGVLQCWALKSALEQMGHEVVVVDRVWGEDEKNRGIWRWCAKWSLKTWIKFFIRSLLGCGDFGKLLRTIRTIRFVRGLGLTKEHFCEWSQIKQSNNQTIKQLDLLVVGSDQVWHCGDWGDPQPYLLEGAPEIKAISYAASFGMAEIPKDWVELYKRGLGRFAALSCREKEGVEICRGLGYAATHVVDPTLLLEQKEWNRLLNGGETPPPRALDKKLVCYFMSVDVAAALPLLERFATRMDCTVEVLANNQYMLHPLPKSASALLRNFRRGRVKICRRYGPKEFVRAFAGATWTLTDSFHAVMFSSIFNCNARFLVPQEGWRKTMFARIEEFAKECITGEFFAADVGEALRSFGRSETVTFKADKIVAMRAESMKWLENAITST